MLKRKPSIPAARGAKAKALSEPSATMESTFIRAPDHLGRMSVGALLVPIGPHIPDVLHALINVAGVSKAELAKQTGLTRGRIGHYLNHNEPVPEDRERQFYEILRDITEANEEDLAKLVGNPEIFREAKPVAQAMVKACRKVLANYEKQHTGQKMTPKRPKSSR